MTYSRLGAAVKRLLRCLLSRRAAVAALAVFVGVYALFVTLRVHTYYIKDGDETQVAFSTRDDLAGALDDSAVTTTPVDTVVDTPRSGFSIVTISRGFSVALTADGKTRHYIVTGGTVGELLERAGVTLSDEDYCSMPLARALEKDDEIEIYRVERTIVEETEEIPFETTYKPTSLIRVGRTSTIVYGQNGRRISAYEELAVDGAVVSRELVYSEITRQPVEQVTLIGGTTPISRLDFSDQYPLDANGVPQHYLSVLRGRKATGYYAKAGAWGSSGGYCYAGTAAVQLSMFPYGTKLYVKGVSGNFVYGYTIANDTGALAENDIALDLFYESYRESALNSLRYVDIYVLEWGDGTVNSPASYGYK